MKILGLESSVFILVAVSGLFFSGFIFYTLLGFAGRRPRSVEMKERGSTVLLPLYLREYWDWTITPVTRVLIRHRVNPDTLSWLSFVLSVGAGAAFAVGYFGLGGWLYILSGTCDMFDGKVARATGQSSKAGAFLDSVLDRYCELFVLGGLAFFFRGTPMAWIVVAGIAGSLMVSYTRARGEGLGFSCREGGMQRAERIVYVGLAGIFGKVAEAFWPAHPWGVTFLSFTITLLAISSNITAIQRFFTIGRRLRDLEGAPVQRRHFVRRSRPTLVRKAGP